MLEVLSPPHGLPRTLWVTLQASRQRWACGGQVGKADLMRREEVWRYWVLDTLSQCWTSPSLLRWCLVCKPELLLAWVWEERLWEA